MSVRMVALALALAASSGSARADFAWIRAEGAEACASEEALRSALLAQGVTPDQLEARRVEGVLEPIDGGFRARVRVLQADGSLGPTRRVETRGADCDALSSSLVLVVAMLVGESAPAGVPIATPERRRPRRDFFFEAAALLGVAWGILPSAGVGPELTFRYASKQRVGALIGFGASLDFAGTRHYADDSRGIALNTLYAPLAVCVDALRTARFLVVPCAGARLGGFVAQDEERTTRDFFAVATVGARLAWNVTERVRLLLDVNAGALLKGPVYRYGRQDMGLRYDEIFRPERFHFYPALGVARAF